MIDQYDRDEFRDHFGEYGTDEEVNEWLQEQADFERQQEPDLQALKLELEKHLRESYREKGL